MYRSICIVLAIASSSVFAQSEPLQWQSSGQAQYVCGGVSEEGRTALKDLRGPANSELLFTEGAEGGFLADVGVTIHGSGLAQPMVFNASGPYCLLQLPRGNYVVDADYNGVKRTQAIKVGTGITQSKINWPKPAER